MRSVRGISLVVCAAAGLFAITACGSGSDSQTSAAAQSSSAASSGSHGTVANLDLVPNQFDQCKNSIMNRVFQQAGFNVATYNSAFNPATSNQNIQDALTKGVKGAIYTAQAAPLDTGSLSKLLGAHLPTVFLYGPKTPGPQPATVVAVNGYGGGVTGAEELVKLKPGVKHVGVIKGVAGFNLTDATYQGIVSGLKQHGITPEAVLTGDFTAQKGAQLAQDMLTSHPEMQAIITLGNDMALAAARVARSSPSKPAVIDVYGFGSAAVQAVANGTLLAMAYEPLDKLGTETATALIDAIEGQPTNKLIPVSMVPIDKSNANSIHAPC